LPLATRRAARTSALLKSHLRLAPEAMVAVMTGRHDQSDLNTYGAEDDEEMDVIFEVLERAATKATPLSGE
jgi:hypothetical protein